MREAAKVRAHFLLEDLSCGLREEEKEWMVRSTPNSTQSEESGKGSKGDVGEKNGGRGGRRKGRESKEEHQGGSKCWNIWKWCRASGRHHANERGMEDNKERTVDIKLGVLDTCGNGCV